MEVKLFTNKKISFIGAGVMAEAMISGLIRNDVIEKSAIYASGPRQVRLENLEELYGINTFTNNSDAACQGDILVLSIKPQVVDKVFQEISSCLLQDVLIISIVAGTPILKIKKGLDRNFVVRSMPNTPAQIGQGITVWASSQEVDDSQRLMAKTILNAFGEDIYMEEEYYLDMATALSGTGPAYVFLFMEAMVDAGVHLGFPRHIAERLVVQTVRGSVNYFDLRGDPVHLARLRNQVTSAGGTTAAALYYLEKAGFRTAISRAIWAAYERSRELGKDAQPHSPENG